MDTNTEPRKLYEITLSDKRKSCDPCHGTGKTRNAQAKEWDSYWLNDPCPVCGGSGRIATGRVTRRDAVRTRNQWHTLTGVFVAFDQDVCQVSPYLDCQCNGCGEKLRFTKGEIDHAEGWIECEKCAGEIHPL